MKLRKTQPIDLNRIMEIVSEARLSLTALGVDQWQYDYPQRELFEQDCKRDESYVVLDDSNTIIATQMISFTGDKGYDHIERGAWLTTSDSTNPHYAAIHRIAAATAYRGSGVGSFLFNSAEEIVRSYGCESIRIDTHADNIPMRKLLKKHGYHACGIILLGNIDGAPERVAFEKIL